MRKIIMQNQIVRQVELKVKDHFHADAERFDAIYEKEKGR